MHASALRAAPPSGLLNDSLPVSASLGISRTYVQRVRVAKYPRSVRVYQFIYVSTVCGKRGTDRRPFGRRVN